MQNKNAKNSGDASTHETDDTNPEIQIHNDANAPSEDKTKVHKRVTGHGVITDSGVLRRDLDDAHILAQRNADRHRSTGPVLLMIGILTGLSAWGLGKLSSKVALKVAQESVELVPVVVAKEDMPQDALLDADSLAQNFIPKELVTASVVVPSKVTEIWGKRLGSPALRGDTIRWEQIKGSEKNRKLSPYIRPGARAYGLAVEARSGLGGWLHYFDEVDIVIVMPNPKDPSNSIAYTLTSGVPVLAAGIEAQSTSKATQYDPEEYDEVSLLLLPEEIEAIAVAQKEGKVRLVLRPPKEPIETRKQDFATFETLFSGVRASTLVEAPKPKPKQIEIIRPKRFRR